MQDSWNDYREKIIGLGEHSSKKSYYPELQEKLELLEASQQNLETILNSISDGIVLHDDKGKIISLNKQAQKLFNIREEEASKFTIMDISSPKMTVTDLPSIWHEVLNGNPKVIEWVCCAIGTEEENEVQVSVNRAKINNAYVLVAVIRDFSERKNYERLLQKSEERFRKLFERSHDAIFIVSRINRSILNANEAAEELTGRTLDEIKSLNVHEVIPFLSEEVFENLISETYKTNEVLFASPSGKKKYAVLSIRLIEDDLAFINAYDITERKDNEEQIENQNAELIKAIEKAKEMDRLKTVFFANMSHELRTPLVGLLGFSEILEGELEGEFRDFANKINTSGKRLLDTLNSILKYSELESHRVQARMVDFDISKLIYEEIDLFKVYADQKGIELFPAFDTKEQIITSDEKLLRGMLSNLINNAVKYTDKGYIKVDLAIDDTNAKIMVIDTGIGIPKEKFHLIFEEFRQASEGVNRIFDGTGLGLSIVRRYAEILGAKIEVVSEVKVGTTFTLEIPISKANSVTLKNENTSLKNVDNLTNSNVAALPKKRILVVDDEPLNTEVISLFLKDKYLIDTAATGNGAISQAMDQHYDAILMDVNLRKEMDGLTAAGLIRKLEGYESIPIVAVTAFAMKGDMEEFLHAGCTNYLSKPFTKKQLLKLLSSILKH